MEERILKITFAKAGNGGRVARLTVPIKWLDKMEIIPEEREVIVKFEDNRIIIEKKEYNSWKISVIIVKYR